MFKDLLSPDIQPSKINIDVPEIILSADIRKKLQTILEEEEGYARVNKASSVVKTDKNAVFFSNSWFYVAVLCKQYGLALYPYCSFFDANVRNNKEVVEFLMNSDIPNLAAKLSISIDEASRFVAYINGGEFRPGKNLINIEKTGKPSFRASKDIFGSCILKKISVPDSSSNYLGNIVYYLSKHEDIYNQLEREINICLQNNMQAGTGNNNRNNVGSFKSGLNSTMSRNIIVFGAPGTGKSFKINEDRKKLLGLRADDDYERVTFHPDYSYANFVGTYKPVMKPNNNYTKQKLDPNTEAILSILNDKTLTGQQKYDQLYETFNNDRLLTTLPILMGITCGTEQIKTKLADGSDSANNNKPEFEKGKALRKFVQLANKIQTTNTGSISYEYVPGPFMRLYVEAMKNVLKVAKGEEEPRPFLLIIEEINRANVAAVFGEIFQLLDRNDDNVSEYPIQTSQDIRDYLAKELGGDPSEYTQIRIPDNMFIWATMNSADQGVFPMDTAFKRRWDFIYLGIDDNDSDIQGKVVKIKVGNTEKDIEWNSLRQAINEFLAKEKINEDKQLGPYFISRKITVPANGGNIIDTEAFNRVFKQKVIPYLFDDAAKQKRSKLFEGIPNEANRYSKICEEYDKIGIGIFAQSIQNDACEKSANNATTTASQEQNRLMQQSSIDNI